MNWLETSAWEEGFDLPEADDWYAEINPYEPGEHATNPPETCTAR